MRVWMRLAVRTLPWLTSMGSVNEPCESLELRVDEGSKLVTAKVPWARVAGMSDEDAGRWLKQLLACRQQWERKGYTFRY